MSDTPDHAQLVWMADRWLSAKANCGIVFRDAFRAVTEHGELPDAIGWRNTVSIMIECKATRSDFLADADKPFRQQPSKGVGDWRFYLCPRGLIRVEELPPGWGLLHTVGRRIFAAHGVPGNVGWGRQAPFRGNKRAEMQMMYSALRRFAVRGHLPVIYLPIGKNVAMPE